MRLADVKVGGRYVIRVGGLLTIVVVTDLDGPNRFVGRNERTGKTLWFSAARLRRPALDTEKVTW